MNRPISRRKHGKGFAYYDESGRITDQATIDRLNRLAVPPAWRQVEIARSPRAKVQAIGIDSAGRRQMIYSPAYRARQEAAKFDRIISFGSRLPRLRRQLERDLARRRLTKEKVVACVIKLMDEAYFRVGNDEYAKRHQTYGVTTLRSKHATIKRDEVIFEFTGKSGQDHVKQVHDPKVARIVKQLDELPGYEIFRYYDEDGTLRRVDSRDVNEYIKRHMGEEYTAKDFRTWGGTLLAVSALAAQQVGADEKARQKALTACIKRVAADLGNTPAVARQSYIDPRIIEAYLQGDAIHETKRALADMRTSPHLHPDEACTLRLLETAGK